MKTITYGQKKWALTGCLLVALGFNLSMHKHTEGVASAELASTSDDVAEAGLDTANGHVRVKYIKMSDKTTMAVITEGTICASCGSSIPLNAAFSNTAKGISSLNVALLKFVSTDAASVDADAPPKKHVKASDDDSDSDATPELDMKQLTQQALDKIKKACDKDNTAAGDKLSCYSGDFGKLLGAKKYDLDEKVLSRFFTDKIEPLLDRQLASAHNAILNSAMGGVSMFSSNSDEDPKQTRKDTLDAIGNLLALVPDKFDKLRQGIIDHEKEIITATAEDVQSSYVQSNNAQDQQTKYIKHNEGDFKLRDMNDLSVGIDEANKYGFDSATNYDRMTDVQADTYYKYIDSYSKLLMGNLTSNPTTYQIPGAAAPGAVGNGTGRVGNDGRGGTVTQGTPGVPGSLPQVTSNPSAGSITFGAVQAVTPEMTAERQRVRNQYGLK